MLPRLKFKYYRYKLLSIITMGKKAKKYKDKKLEIKEKIKKVRNFIIKGK